MIDRMTILLVVVLALCVGLLRGTADATCRVNEIQVVDNFNISKYLGRWYEIRWLAASYIPASDLFQDYYHNYVATPTSNVTGMVRGRYPNELDKCFSTNVTLAMTNERGKMIRYVGNDSSPYWVIDTDYTSYALVYGCYNVSQNNTCNGASMWFWSRTPSMESLRLAYLSATAESRLCLNLTYLLTTTHNNECPLHPVDSAAFMEANLLMVALMAVMAKVLSR